MIENSPYLFRAMTFANVFLILCVLYFIFMDIMLYFRIQHYPLKKEANSSDYPAHCPDYSPICYVTVKAVMLDHVNHYIFCPIIAILDYIFHISFLSFITPNIVSFSHVIVAAISAKFISNHVLASRRIGVILFEIRTLLDDLDGHIARTRKHIHGEGTDFGSVGFFIDGICDGIGIVFLLIGIYIFLKNNPSRRDYLPLQTSFVDKIDFSETYRKKLLNKRLMQVMGCITGQFMLSSTAWNRYIAVYQDLLERPSASQTIKTRQLIIYRSNYFLFTAWLWRIFNIHNYLHIALLTIVYDRLWEFLKCIKFLGFGMLLTVICLTEMHVLQVEHFIYGNSVTFDNSTQIV